MEMEGEMELRRRKSLHIVYFLCRNGKVEHPHLISVHHNLDSNGVHLRDVKRWLSELRGKEMPESYAWSYKRRYNGGYVWQDLTDNDPITPISHNEYVVKGSLRPSLTKTMEGFPRSFQHQKSNKYQVEAVEDKEEETKGESKIPQAVEDPPVISASGCEGAPGETAVFKIDSWREEKRRREKQRPNEIALKNGIKPSCDTGPRWRAASALRKLLWCRTVDKIASALRAACREDDSTPQSSRRRSISNERKSLGAESRKMGAGTASAMCKNANCSQCGKAFKPEKLHTHMMSCRAMKEKGRSRSSKRERSTATTMALSTGALEVTVTVL